MGLRRSASAALAVAVLALLGTACEPTGTPPVKLELDISPSGTYEILTSVIAVDVRVSCPQPVGVVLEAAFPVPYGEQSLSTSPGGHARTGVQCPGPAGGTFTTKWEWPYPAPASKVIRMYSTKSYVSGGGLATVWIRDGVADAETVTFTRILCWPGAPACTNA